MNRTRFVSLLAAAAAIVTIGLLAQPGAAQLRTRASSTNQIATVQLRHDLIGLKTDTSMVIDDSIIAARASITGKLISVGEEFIVLEMQSDHEVWIPRSNVLVIHIRG